MNECLDILRNALASPIGLIVKSQNPEADKNAFRKAIQDSNDAAFAVLQIRTSPRNPNNEIWILNMKAIENAQN